MFDGPNHWKLFLLTVSLRKAWGHLTAKTVEVPLGHAPHNGLDMEESEPPNEGVTSQFFRHHRLSTSRMNSPYRALMV